MKAYGQPTHGPQEHAPAGFRLLLQCFDAQSEADARATLARTFGHAKADLAVFHAGTYRTVSKLKYLLEYQPTGFMAFVPKKEAK